MCHASETANLSCAGCMTGCMPLSGCAALLGCCRLQAACLGQDRVGLSGRRLKLSALCEFSCALHGQETLVDTARFHHPAKEHASAWKLFAQSRAWPVSGSPGLAINRETDKFSSAARAEHAEGEYAVLHCEEAPDFHQTATLLELRPLPKRYPQSCRLCLGAWPCALQNCAQIV